MVLKLLKVALPLYNLLIYKFLFARWGIIITFLAIGAFEETNVGAFLPGKKFMLRVEVGILELESSS
jgi:hypothetical protein